jgi:hypothetical protein
MRRVQCDRGGSAKLKTQGEFPGNVLGGCAAGGASEQHSPSASKALELRPCKHRGIINIQMQLSHSIAHFPSTPRKTLYARVWLGIKILKMSSFQFQIPQLSSSTPLFNIKTPTRELASELLF